MADTSVLIIGAGPTGLVLALWVTQQGVPVRIVDKSAGPGTSSRALAVHARALELYRQLGLDAPVMAQGYTVPGVRLWIGGQEKVRVPFNELVSDLTPYGFLHIFPQDEHERLLIERLETRGVRVERSTECLGYDDQGDHIVATLRSPDGQVGEVRAAFIAGCDGARSAVREAMGVGFPGGTYPQTFYVADVAGHGPAYNGDLNVELDEADFLATFPLAPQGRVRLIGDIKAGEHGDGDLTFDDISDRSAKSLGVEVDQVNWFSTYRVHHRVTERFRQGRAFLLGDAAHLHTPVGGQGMNTGIGDAINLAWKLKAVLQGAADGLLDTYQAERRAFALRLVATTDQAFTFVASEGRLAQIVRTRIVPAVFPVALKSKAVRNFIFRTVSQLTLNYRGMGLDKGRAGRVHGGERLPWIKLGDSDNYAAFARIDWQVHVYGTIEDGLQTWCDNRGVRLECFAWTDAMDGSGLRKDALYLLRPDSYVALAQPDQATEPIDRYFESIGLSVLTNA
jgi:2-polyprenyl-6-methoxyphenol hydroxylase-like FAD-dependent oxidoreductase